MKKIFYSFCLLAFMSLISCSNEQGQVLTPTDENPISKTEAFSNLNMQLKAYSKQFDAQKYDKSHTRGFWRNLWKVVKSDFYGGLAGGGIVAAGESYSGHSFKSSVRGVAAGALVGAVLGSLYQALSYTSMQSYSIKVENSAICCIGTDLAQFDSVGYYHNEIIQGIINENPDLSLKDSLKIIRLVENNVQNVFDISEQEVRDITESYRCVNAEMHAVDFRELKNKFPQIKEEIDIAELYFDNVSCLTTQEDVKEYTQGVRDIVVESSIPLESKCLINSSTSVAMNSNVLWKITE